MGCHFLLFYFHDIHSCSFFFLKSVLPLLFAPFPPSFPSSFSLHFLPPFSHLFLMFILSSCFCLSSFTCLFLSLLHPAEGFSSLPHPLRHYPSTSSSSSHLRILCLPPPPFAASLPPPLPHFMEELHICSAPSLSLSLSFTEPREDDLFRLRSSSVTQLLREEEEEKKVEEEEEMEV